MREANYATVFTHKDTYLAAICTLVIKVIDLSLLRRNHVFDKRKGITRFGRASHPFPDRAPPCQRELKCEGTCSHISVSRRVLQLRRLHLNVEEQTCE